MNKQAKRENKKQQRKLKKRNKKKIESLSRVMVTGFGLICLCLLISLGFYLPTHPQKFDGNFSMAPYNTLTSVPYVAEGTRVQWDIAYIKTLEESVSNFPTWYAKIQDFNILGHEDFDAEPSTEEGIEDGGGQPTGKAKRAVAEYVDTYAYITFTAPQINGPSTITVNAKLKTWVAVGHRRGFSYSEGPVLSQSGEIIIYDSESPIISKYNLFTNIWQYSLWATIGIFFVFVFIPLVFMPDK